MAIGTLTLKHKVLLTSLFEGREGEKTVGNTFCSSLWVYRPKTPSSGSYFLPFSCKMASSKLCYVWQVTPTIKWLLCHPATRRIRVRVSHQREEGHQQKSRCWDRARIWERESRTFCVTFSPPCKSGDIFYLIRSRWKIWKQRNCVLSKLRLQLFLWLYTHFCINQLKHNQQACYLGHFLTNAFPDYLYKELTQYSH